MSYTLREPQIKTLNSIRAEMIKGHKKMLVSAPTGFGKTVLAYEIARSAIKNNNRVLFTSHRIQLAEQTRDKFKSLKPAFLQGNSEGYNENSLLLVATLQTLINREIIEPKIVIIDEVHYAYESKLVQSLFEKFQNAIFIGLSATPVDNRNYLLEGFDSIIDEFQTIDLIKLKWLVPFNCYAPFTPDLSNVKILAGEYKKDELEEAVNKPDVNKTIIENYIKYGEGRKFICFAVDKKHAFELNRTFINQGIKTNYITADTPESERLTTLAALKSGSIQGLINIEILTAGFDEPTLCCVILACPTKSWKKYIQCAGRGIRLNGLSFEQSVLNGKVDCILLDCAGAIEEHGLPDDRKKFIFGTKISKVIDRELNLDTDIKASEKVKQITEEKQIYLKRIGSLLDLYDGKVYNKEAEFQEDVNNYLSKTSYFWWRQNSGKMYKDGRWVHFASKSGLPDNTVFYKDTSIYFGLELKLKTGRLTDHQKQTLPEMIQRKVLFFICESVFDVYRAIEHLESNITETPDKIIIDRSIHEMPEWQKQLREKLKL